MNHGTLRQFTCLPFGSSQELIEQRWRYFRRVPTGARCECRSIKEPLQLRAESRALRTRDAQIRRTATRVGSVVVYECASGEDGDLGNLLPCCVNFSRPLACFDTEVGNLLRFDAIGDAAWATDEVSGLDNELLAGVGLQGSFIGPWETLIQVDLGTPLAGPDDGLVAYVVFLKLFD